MSCLNPIQTVTIGPRRMNRLRDGESVGGAGIPKNKIPRKGALPVQAVCKDSGESMKALLRRGGKTGYLSLT